MKIRLMALWLAGLALAASAAACSGGGDDQPSAGDASAVPSAVQQGRILVEADIELGEVDAAADAAHLFYAMSCVDGLLTITTTEETVYAELPCDRALTSEIVGRFSYVPVRMRIVTAMPAKLYLESSTAGSVEFTVGRVWIEHR